MKKDRRHLVVSLLEQDDDFKQLYEQHRDLDRQVSELEKKGYLSSAQQLERSKLKKLKLRSKDQMEAILSSHEESTMASASSFSSGT